MELRDAGTSGIEAAPKNPGKIPASVNSLMPSMLPGKRWKPALESGCARLRA